MAVESVQPQPEPRPEPTPEEAFLASFDALAQAVRRARGATGGEGSLTLSQYGLLQALSGRQAARVRDLADEAGIAPSTATRILDALERRAIVRRTRSAEDRRGVTVSLTQEGRQALDAQDAWLRGRQRAFYAGLPDSERELAPDLLVRLAALIDELASGPRGPR
jgi:DNA-binding MarR family transcriptional regulator